MGDEGRVVTIPNLVSVLRLCGIPVFLWLLFGRENRAAAAALLGVLGASDSLDGFIARRFDQVSSVGKVLDPAADRILIGTGVVAILVDGSAPLWAGALTLVREIAVSAGVLVVAALGGRRIDVQVVGKAGNFATMAAFPLFLASHSTVGWRTLAGALAWVFVIPGLVLSWYAAATYLPLARRALVEARP
ncbi:MAG: CDP-alcohol phosphatidyltransferase family protein [Acidimicrobiales bacterium]